MKFLGQIIGSLLICLGGLRAFAFLLFCSALFSRVDLYAWGILSALIRALPAILITVALIALGQLIKTRANQMPSPDYPDLRARFTKSVAFAKEFSVHRKGATMTTNYSQQPNESQDKPSNTAPSPNQPGVYNPITLEDVHSTAQSPSPDPFAKLDSRTRILIAPLFGLIFALCKELPALAPLNILILTVCLVLRFNTRQRQIAAVPLALGGLKLAWDSAVYFARWMSPDSGSAGISHLSQSVEAGAPWLPIFFSICLVYMPTTNTKTFKSVITGSLLVLASGLLPREGYLTVFDLINNVLFVVVVVCIFLDFKPNALRSLAHTLVNGASGEISNPAATR
jgi:hypothetical protein